MRREYRCALVGAVWLASLGVTFTASAQGPRVRDSAGVRIVENVRGSWGDTRRIVVEPIPSLVLGGPGAREEKFLDVKPTAARLGNGDVAVVDQARFRISWFDSTGKLLRHTGARGPGETAGQFNYMGRIIPVGKDAVALYDGALARYTEFDRKGVVRRWDHFNPAPYLPHPMGKGRAFRDLFGSLTDGRLIGYQFDNWRDGRQQLVTESLTVMAVSSSGKWTRIMPALRQEYSIVNDGIGRPSAMDVRPFGRVGLFAVRGSDWLYADGQRYEVEVRSLDGALRKIIRIRRSPIPVAGADISRFTAVRLARTDTIVRSVFAKAFRTLPYPANRPAFAGLIVDAAGLIWAKNWAFDGEPALWEVFDPDGVLLGQVEVPADLDVLEIGRDYLLARVDKLNSENEVRIYRLKRAPP
ncbi:MAG: hypothetical protein V4558_11560 [Gemmatimonadota bacterium]